MTILFTAFDPFGGENINPALESVRILPDLLCGAEIVKLEVPTVFGKSIDTVIKAIDKHQPDAVISIGQAGGRHAITIERIAINVDDATIEDNEGNIPVDTPVYPDGPTAYFSTLPIKVMIEAIRKEGLPAGVSNSAGTFVCNHLLYGVLHYIHTNELPARAGFIHVPYIPEQVALKSASLPSMSIEDIARALRAAIRAAIADISA